MNINLMIETLEARLSKKEGRVVSIQKLEREPFIDSTSFAAEKLQILIDNNGWLSIFFKDLNPHHLLEDAQQLREPGLARSHREVYIYEHLLSQTDLNTPQIYGLRWEPQNDMLWLFLEYVCGDRLWHMGDLCYWAAAAQWAAKFHVAASKIPQLKRELLVQYDRAHYMQCATHLEEKLGVFTADQRTLVQDALHHYLNMIDQFAELPYGVIHNDFFGQNILIRPDCDDKLESIVVIDWELAAWGPSYLDVVSLSAGNWTAEQRLGMWQAYFEQYQAEAGIILDWTVFCWQLNQLALYQALTWLGWWAGRDEKQVNQWLQELDRIYTSYSF